MPAIHSRQSRTPTHAKTCASLQKRLGVSLETIADTCGDHACDESPGDRSLIEIVREVVELSTGKRVIGSSRDEILRRASMSFADIDGVFTTAFSAALVEAYESAIDTTQSFTVEGSNPNFQAADRVRLSKFGIRKHTRHSTAADIAYSSNVESVRVARYSGKFSIDEMDLIDDRFGAITQHTPAEMGEAAAQLRPDLVFYILLANPNMADGSPLFDSSRGNVLTSAALSPTTLKSAITAINTFSENGVTLGRVRQPVLLTSESSSFDADQLSNSVHISNDGGQGNRNPIKSRGVQPVSDARIDNGVRDPDTEALAAGQPTTWFVAQGGSRAAIEVVSLNGAKLPQIRATPLAHGQFGICFDVTFDIGAKAIRPLGMIRATA